MTRTPDPLDPDEAWATPDTFTQCGNSQCFCATTGDQFEQGDIE